MAMNDSGSCDFFAAKTESSAKISCRLADSIANLPERFTLGGTGARTGHGSTALIMPVYPTDVGSHIVQRIGAIHAAWSTLVGTRQGQRWVALRYRPNGFSPGTPCRVMGCRLPIADRTANAIVRGMPIGGVLDGNDKTAERDKNDK